MNRQPTIDIKSSNETVVSTERPVVQGGTIIFPVNKTETGIESVSFGFLVSISSFYFGDALEGDYDVYFKAHASTVVYWDGTYNYDAKNLMNSSTSSISLVGFFICSVRHNFHCGLSVTVFQKLGCPSLQPEHGGLYQ